MQAPESIRQSLDEAQSKLEHQLGLALETMDQASRPILAASETVARRAGRGGPARGESRPARSAPTPLSNRGVTSPGKTLKGSGKAAGRKGK
jgi:hypothetical protein